MPAVNGNFGSASDLSDRTMTLLVLAPADVLDEALDSPAVGGAEHFVGVRPAQQEEVATFGLLEIVLRVHGRVTGRAVGIVLVELDDVVRAEVLGRRIAAERFTDDAGQV